MTTATALWRLACSFLLGGCLGLLYGFLHPSLSRHRLLSDAVFSLAAVWGWIYICFAVCRGDIRTVYLLAMGTGILLWHSTCGPWLQPVFSGFWSLLGRLFRLFLAPWKKILEITKILFASAEKWVTIKCTKICKSGQKRRKKPHGKQQHPALKCESGSSSRIQNH